MKSLIATTASLRARRFLQTVLTFTVTLHFAQAQESISVLLTNAQQIVALGTNIPPNRYQARIKGVVTYVPAGTARVYLQESELGLQVNLSGSTTRHRVGSLLEVTGTVLGGDPSLRLGNATATVLGDAQLPPAPLVSPHSLVRGQDPFRYVKVRGMVRDMFSNRAGLTLLVTHDGYPFEVNFQTANAPLPRDWLDAEIEVTGHCNPIYSATTGKPTAIRFFATDTNDVHVITPGVADSFDGRPLLTIAEAAKLSNDLKPRYRVAGTVIVYQEGATCFFIDDGTGVMLVDTTFGFLRPPADAQHLQREPQTTLQPGERVEVLGARHNWFALTPSLMATEFRRRGHGELPKSIAVTLPELQAGRHAGRLVSLRAQLVDQRRWSKSNLRQSLELVLRDEDNVFLAVWEGDNSVKWELPIDGYLQVTGVNHAEAGSNPQRCTFKVMLRSPADVVRVPAPPAWTRPEFQRIGFAVGGVTVLALGWVWMLRRQIRRRTAALAEANAQLQQTAAKLAESEILFRTAFDSSPAMVSLIRVADERYVRVNDALCRAAEYSREEMIGRTLTEMKYWTSTEQREAATRELREHGRIRDRELLLQTRSGRLVTLLVSADVIEVNGEPHILTVAVEITERKQAEEGIQRALSQERELNRLKTLFVSTVSHEFRTPLEIILTSADILARYLERLSPEKRAEHLANIQSSVKRMSGMMQDVLLLGRIEAGKLEFKPRPLQLQGLCERVVDEMHSASARPGRIVLRTEGGLEGAHGDEALLRHILMNLLSNALKYSPEDSSVTVTATRQDGNAVFAVADHGRGIPTTDHPHLFQSFHRGSNVNDTPGTGLGLLLVSRCVEIHGGRIRFESEEDEGTTFFVELPLFAQTRTPAPTLTPTQPV